MKTLTFFAALVAFNIPSMGFAQGTPTTEKPFAQEVFARVGGRDVTYGEYLRALERQTVQVPGGQTTNAARLVLDQLVGNAVILAEAEKFNVLPTDKDVARFYDTQKKLFEAQYPGTNYEESMKEQGTTPEDIQSDMRLQLAEVNVYVTRLKISDADVRKAYTTASAAGSVGLPVRVQLRLIVAAPDSADFRKAQTLLRASTPFEDVARLVNPPQLKATAGLLPQATAINKIGVEYQAKVQKIAPGTFFGPVDFRLAADKPTVKAWIRLEKRLPALNIPYEDASPLIRRELVQTKLQDPANAKVREMIMGMKVNAKFEPTDSKYNTIWDGLKKTAQDAGIGTP